MTSEEGAFVAGDAQMGASLVVRALDAGRKPPQPSTAGLRAEAVPAESSDPDNTRSKVAALDTR